MKFLLSLIVMSIFSTEGFSATKVRIGWQVPWAVQGQLVQIWKHTDILRKNGIEAEFIGRTYGPELNELALADEVDVVLTADQPAAALFSKTKDWAGVARLMHNRVATYVPPKSTIKNLKDLKNKTIGLPFGAAAQRILVENLQSNGLNPEKDGIRLINLGMLEHGPLIMRSKPESLTWDQFDALSGFDPLPAILEAKGVIRVIDTGKICSMVLMNTKFLQKNAEAAKKLSAALKDAYSYYRQNQEIANKWFLEEAKLTNATSEALTLAASLEKNLKVKTDKEIDITFTQNDFEIMQKAADFVSASAGKKINIKEFVSNDYLK